MSIKLKKVGFFYILKINNISRIIKDDKDHLVDPNMNIYKFGVSEYQTPYKRFNQYPNDSEVIIYWKIDNLYENETKVINIFKNKYSIDHNCLKGKEYFSGNLYEAIEDIKNVIYTDIIHGMNLDNDLISENFRRINIYYDDRINTKYYNFMKEFCKPDNFICNSENRIQNMRILNINYRNLLLQKIKNKRSEELQTETHDKSLIHFSSVDIEFKKEISEIRIIDPSDSNQMKEENDDHSKLDHTILSPEEYTYICHHCIEYTTKSLSDMIKHFKRDKKCKQNSSYNYSDANTLSRKKYIMNTNTECFTIDDYTYIIKNYTNRINIINDDYKNIERSIVSEPVSTQNSSLFESSTIQRDFSATNLSHVKGGASFVPNVKEDQCVIVNSIDSETFDENKAYEESLSEDQHKILSDICKSSVISFELFNSIPKDETFIKQLIKKKKSNILDININSYLVKCNYPIIHFNLLKNVYVCNHCEADYTHVNSIKRHFKNKTCIRRKEINNILEKCK